MELYRRNVLPEAAAGRSRLARMAKNEEGKNAKGSAKERNDKIHKSFKITKPAPHGRKGERK